MSRTKTADVYCARTSNPLTMFFVQRTTSTLYKIKIFFLTLSCWLHFCKGLIFCQSIQAHRKNHLSIFFTILFIYLTESTSRERQAEGEGEVGSQQSREPDARLDPKTLRSGPELKVAT